MKKNKKIAIFIALVLVITGITGFIYGMNKKIDVNFFLDTIKNSRTNLYLTHSSYVIIIFLSTLALINIGSQTIIFGIEGLSMGFTMGVLFKSYKLNGLFFGVLINIVNKLLFIIIISYLFIISVNYINKTIKNILGYKNDYIRTLIKPLILRFLIILGISIINDTIIYFFGNMFLKNFINML